MPPIPLALNRYRDIDSVGVVGYVMGGTVGLGGTMDVGRALIDAGICLLEVGIPFSDPTADGPTIRLQSQRALAGGARMDTCIDQAQELASISDVPIVTMGYTNPVFAYGVDAYAKRLAAGRIAGTIIADSPLEEPLGIRSTLSSHSVAFIPLATPTSTTSRLKRLADAARDDAFIYCVARRGVTGKRRGDDASGLVEAQRQATQQLLEDVRSAAPAAPRAVGFGIATVDDVRALRSHTEAVVVASAMFDHIESVAESRKAGAAHSFISELVAAGSS